ncbi:MAG: 4-hydroxy-tetrahydrodipicolinate reductase [Bacteroidetes bacterium]|nr:4-hydroxy-tetrahydrodipicolinate reductase [Bacteroidota bacterium]
MRIALIGYGKMGKAIEEIAVKAGHTITSKSDIGQLNVTDLAKAEVAIEFTQANSVKENVIKCFEANVPVVIGTTGWYSQFDEIKEIAQNENKTMFYSTNFSLGVNIFFALNKYLAKLMNQYEMYEPSITEAHHVHKLDSPSGTAITLAEGLISNFNRKKQWVNSIDNNTNSKNPFDLNIESIRKDEIPGTHTVIYKSEIDDISITHQAHNRMGFAMGALKAAEWLKGKNGIFTMNDMLKF